MISPKQVYPLRVEYFQTEQVENSFQRVISSVHIISQKQVVIIREFSSTVKNLQKILKLSMNVSTNSDWPLQIYNVLLRLQNLFGLIADLFYLFFFK